MAIKFLNTVQVDTDVLYVDAANNKVGIGTTSPDGLLHIDGISDSKSGLVLEASNNGDNRSIDFQNTAGALRLGIEYDNVNINLNVVDRNRDKLLTVRESGNVGIGTTTPSEKLEVNGTVIATATTDAYKGYIKQTITSSASEKAVSADYNLIPYNTLTTVDTDQPYNRMVAAYDGRIKKVYIRNTGGNTPSADTVNFKKQVNNTTAATVYSATVANASSAGMSAVYNFADSDFTFNEGDTFGILYQTVNNVGGGRAMGGVAINVIVEYNIT